MAVVDKLEIAVKTNIEYARYMLVLFPVATYMKVGSASLLTVLGIPVYKRIGQCRSLFGYSWTRE